MQGKHFYTITFSFFTGVFVASFVYLNKWLFVGIAICSLSGFFINKFRSRGTSLLVCLVCVSFSLGVIRFQISKTDVHPLDEYVETKTSFTGIVCAEPEDREFTQRFCFQPVIESQPTQDRIVVSANRFPKYEYGDELTLTGKIEFPENFTAYEGGPEFDYISYLEKDSFRYILSRPAIRKIGDGKGSRLVSVLISIKSAFMSNVEDVLPEPHSSFVAGLLLGEKGGLPQYISDNFKRSGLTHILVLSGSNVTVVAEALMNIFSFLPRLAGQFAGAFSIILFAVMTGASATTIRATLMAMVLLMSRGVGRRYDVVRALILAAVAMLMHNPRILAFDISFQLSFLATIAVIYVSPIVKEYLGWVTERFGFRETLAMTLSVQIFTLPFILYKMGEISVIALVPNLLVLPLVPYVMFGGFLAGMIGFFGHFGYIGHMVAVPIAWTTQAALSYMLKVVEFFGGFVFATTKITIGVWWLFVSYVALIVGIWRLTLCITERQKNSARQSAN